MVSIPIGDGDTWALTVIIEFVETFLGSDVVGTLKHCPHALSCSYLMKLSQRNI